MERGTGCTCEHTICICMYMHLIRLIPAGDLREAGTQTGEMADDLQDEESASDILRFIIC